MIWECIAGIAWGVCWKGVDFLFLVHSVSESRFTRLPSFVSCVCVCVWCLFLLCDGGLLQVLSKWDFDDNLCVSYSLISLWETMCAGSEEGLVNLGVEMVQYIWLYSSSKSPNTAEYLFLRRCFFDSWKISMLEIVMESVYISVWKNHPQSSISSSATKKTRYCRFMACVGAPLSNIFHDRGPRFGFAVYVCSYLLAMGFSVSLLLKTCHIFLKKKAEHVGTDVRWPLMLFLLHNPPHSLSFGLLVNSPNWFLETCSS